jgi:hypothetical protein
VRSKGMGEERSKRTDPRPLLEVAWKPRMKTSNRRFMRIIAVPSHDLLSINNQRTDDTPLPIYFFAPSSVSSASTTNKGAFLRITLRRLIQYRSSRTLANWR